MSINTLAAKFYERDTATVARDLLGKVLCRKFRGIITSGRIVETEAYLPSSDPACHAFRGKTERNAQMFAAAGTAYVYTIHAKFCFNVVTEDEGLGCAVLVRAIEPQEGIAAMLRRRACKNELDIGRGPARLCQALRLDLKMNGHKLTSNQKLWIETAPTIPDSHVGKSPRIGISQNQDAQLRFFENGSRYVSGARHWHTR